MSRKNCSESSSISYPLHFSHTKVELKKLSKERLVDLFLATQDYTHYILSRVSSQSKILSQFVDEVSNPSDLKKSDCSKEKKLPIVTINGESGCISEEYCESESIQMEGSRCFEEETGSNLDCEMKELCQLVEDVSSYQRSDIVKELLSPSTITFKMQEFVVRCDEQDVRLIWTKLIFDFSLFNLGYNKTRY